MMSAKPSTAGSRATSAALPRLGFFRRRFARWIALGEGGFPFAIGRPATPVARLRAVGRRARFAGRKPWQGALAKAAMTLAWPVGAFATALRVCRNSRARGVHYGLPQFAHMYWLALRHSIPPLEYALYRFDRPQARKHIHDYLYWTDLRALPALTARGGGDARDVQDKDRFAAVCTRHGIAHVPTLAVFEQGRQKFPAAPFVPDAPALWVKALRLKGGAGGARWVKDGDAYCNQEGDRVSATGLGDRLRREDCLVQPFLANHPDLAPLTNGALAALRIVTGIDANGETQFVVALLVLPYGESRTSGTGVLCSIAFDSGRLQAAALADGTPVALHPDSGAPIAGLVLPYWRESIDLVRRAHKAAFARFPFLGWDIALTQDGPVVLETNIGWGVLFHQMLDGPIGHTAFSRLILPYL